MRIASRPPVDRPRSIHGYGVERLEERHLLAASLFIVWMLKTHPGQTLFCLAVSLILGGALGNVIDRLIHGYVVDFIQVHWRGWYFPSFNVADSAITVGAGALILDEILRVRRGR